MAHLPSVEIQVRRQGTSQEIIAEWQVQDRPNWVAIQCPCRIDCGCIPLNQVARIVISNCLYVGELDYYYVTHTFMATYGFRVL